MTDWITSIIVFCTLDILLNIVSVAIAIYSSIVVFGGFKNVGLGANKEITMTFEFFKKHILDGILNATKYLFAIILVFLLIMYIFWTIIQLLIPEYLYPLPIPIRSILADLPPLPQLKESGIFNLFDSIICIFFKSNENFLRILGFTTESVGSFLKTSTKYILKTVYPQIDLDKFENNIKKTEFYKTYLKNQTNINYTSSYFCHNNNDNNDNNNENENKDNNNENKDNSMKDLANSKEIKEANQIINNEIQNCINKDFIITTPDMNEMEKLSIQLKNTILSTKCNINSISSKIKAANIV